MQRDFEILTSASAITRDKYERILHKNDRKTKLFYMVNEKVT